MTGVLMNACHAETTAVEQQHQCTDIEGEENILPDTVGASADIS